MHICDMKKLDLLKLHADDIGNRRLETAEFMHIAATLGAWWKYDYDAAEEGKVGMHAELKSGKHSDIFFVSKILLEPENIRQIIAKQMVMIISENIPINMIDYIVGVPDGATKLGEDISKIIGIETIKMEKIDGRISLVSPIKAGKFALPIEDSCTQGTGLIEAVKAIIHAQPGIAILPYNPVILNRGGLKDISIEKVGTFKVLPVIEWQAWDCDPTYYCPLCEIGSIAIKPKASDENWQKITTSQL